MNPKEVPNSYLPWEEFKALLLKGGFGGIKEDKLPDTFQTHPNLIAAFDELMPRFQESGVITYRPLVTDRSKRFLISSRDSGAAAFQNQDSTTSIKLVGTRLSGQFGAIITRPEGTYPTTSLLGELITHSFAAIMVSSFEVSWYLRTDQTANFQHYPQAAETYLQAFAQDRSLILSFFVEPGSTEKFYNLSDADFLHAHVALYRMPRESNLAHRIS